jgi:hypothetical protein
MIATHDNIILVGLPEGAIPNSATDPIRVFSYEISASGYALDTHYGMQTKPDVRF